MLFYLAVILLGIVAGLRSMTAPAVLSWAAHCGWIDLSDSWFAFLGYSFTPFVITALAIGELIFDKLPSTPSRKATGPFAGRILSGAFCGAVIGSVSGAFIGGIAAGVIGAFLGTTLGYELRIRFARAFGDKDLPVAIAEDLIAIAAGFFAVIVLL